MDALNPCLLWKCHPLGFLVLEQWVMEVPLDTAFEVPLHLPVEPPVIAEQRPELHRAHTLAELPAEDECPPVLRVFDQLREQVSVLRLQDVCVTDEDTNEISSTTGGRQLARARAQCQINP